MTDTAIITPDGVSATAQTVENSYVAPEERVLDPSTLTTSLLERMPNPTGYRMLILPYRGKGVTSGGIALSRQTVDEDQIQTVVGYVLKQGPAAYKDKDKFPDGPWCKEKDWIVFPRYGGSRFKIEGGEVRVLNDDEVIATIINPDDILSF
jgi:co-chaperonin GroES (HSP10)